MVVVVVGRGLWNLDWPANEARRLIRGISSGVVVVFLLTRARTITAVVPPAEPAPSLYLTVHISLVCVCVCVCVYTARICLWNEWTSSSDSGVSCWCSCVRILSAVVMKHLQSRNGSEESTGLTGVWLGCWAAGRCPWPTLPQPCLCVWIYE